MAISRSELLNYLDQLLSPGLFEDYAPNGLQVGGRSEMKKLAFAVSATQDSLNKAIDWGADTLIVHHGIFWKYQGARTITGPWGERVKLLVKNDLNLLAYHLPLDAHPEVGNAAALASLLGLVEQALFALHKKQPLGVKGKLPSPLSARDLALKLGTILTHPVILATPDETSPVRSLGIITGGANNDWVKAKEDGLDAYLTGEISEYNWHDAREAEIHYFAGGHHATEKFGIQALMRRIQLEFKDVEVRYIDSANPA